VDGNIGTVSNLRIEDITLTVTIYVHRCQTVMLEFYNIYHMIYVETQKLKGMPESHHGAGM